jgi:2-polyprenyl-3-methyl-5-hydroxy-6-metoxy-1,4-benzoquinol methylase
VRNVSSPFLVRDCSTFKAGAPPARPLTARTRELRHNKEADRKTPVSDNPYNTVPYSTLPQQQTHPARMGAIATVLGMQPAPVTQCRTLEIGCGNGANLIPMAAALPQSQFVGVDLAQDAVAAACQTVAALGLRNISFIAADLRNIDESYGEFDYIAAHGVYSWVPEPVRDALLAICRCRLSPSGIAFISYNTYPGAHVLQMFREMMLYHSRHIDEPAQRIERSRWLVKYLLESNILTNAWAGLLQEVGKTILERNSGGLFHDDLSDSNDPVYFRDFIAHARRHGLQYVGESEVSVNYDPKRLLASAMEQVSAADRIEREQYMDFLRLRRFRQTLLCHEELALSPDPDARYFDSLHFSADLHVLEDGRLQGRTGSCTIMNDLVPRVAEALADAHPRPVAFYEMLPHVGDSDALRDILLGFVHAGFADIHIYNYPCESGVSPRPRGLRLARYQATQSEYVTNACHIPVKLDEVGRCILYLLDGSRTVEDLARDLAITPEHPPVEEIARHLPVSLEWMAKHALLEA